MPEYQLGLIFPPKVDGRNLQFKRYLLPLRVPKEYDWEKEHQVSPLPIHDQDGVPACTVFSAANSQQRYEYLEQNKRVIKFGFNELLRKYEKIEQPGGGGYMLDLMNLWRQEGFRHYYPRSGLGRILDLLGFRRYIDHKIDGFVQVGISPEEIKQAIYLFGVCELGILVTQDFVDSYSTPVTGRMVDSTLLGGHAMCANAYDSQGITVVHTWTGRYRQRISWDYCLAKNHEYGITMLDEFYGAVDAKNPRIGEFFDMDSFMKDLSEVGKRPGETIDCLNRKF
jgi:hypothetical protein